MFYGLIMDTIRDGILQAYGPMIWKRIVHELNLPSEVFDFQARYDDRLLIEICDRTLLFFSTLWSSLEYMNLSQVWWRF